MIHKYFLARIRILIQIFSVLSKKRRKQIFFIFLLLFISIFLEILSIGSIVPFVDSILHLGKYSELPYVLNVINFLNIEKENDIRLFFTIGFIFFVFLAAMFKIFLTWYTTSITNFAGHEINNLIFKSTIHQDYLEQVNSNSSNFIGNITKSEDVLSAIGHILNFIISFTQLLFILIFLSLFDYSPILFSGLGIMLFYIFMVRFLKKRIESKSKIQAKTINSRFKVMQESLYNIREIIIGNSYDFFINQFKNYDLKLKKINISIHLFSFIPGIFLVTFTLMSMAIIIYFESLSNQSLQDALPILTAFVYAAQKLLGLGQMCYVSYTKVQLSAYSIYDALNIILLGKNREKLKLNLNNQDTKIIEFKNNISIKKGSFRYSEDSYDVLKDLTIDIKKNSFNLFLGSTGSGKSTLVDIIMGLIPLDKGILEIDSMLINKNDLINYQKLIAHVSQQTGFIDGTIIENIAFSVSSENIDMKKIEECSKIACIQEFIINSKEKYNTTVGENGSLLSGGQRQRLSIARALYSNKEIIILDEATNALDPDTESQLFKNLITNKNNKTFIIISHRESNIVDHKFDKIYKIKDKLIEIIK